MTWECAECHVPEGEGVRIDTVCHHCGKPLCLEDRKIRADPAFMSPADVNPKAVHCHSCWSEYHR